MMNNPDLLGKPFWNKHPNEDTPQSFAGIVPMNERPHIPVDEKHKDALNWAHYSVMEHDIRERINQLLWIGLRSGGRGGELVRGHFGW